MFRKLWEFVTPQNEEAQRRADASNEASLRKIAEAKGFKHGTLATQAGRDNYARNNQTPRFNLGQATAESAYESGKMVYGGVDRFSRMVAATLASPYADRMAQQEQDRANRLLKPSYGNLYEAYGMDRRLGENAAEIDADQIRYNLSTAPMVSTGVGVNDSRNTLNRKVFGAGAEAALDIATMGTGPTAFRLAKAGKSAKPSILAGGGLNLASSGAYLAQQDQIDPVEAAKQLAIATAMGVAIPAIGAIGGKGVKAANKPVYADGEVPKSGFRTVEQKLKQLEADGKGDTKIAKRMRANLAKPQSSTPAEKPSAKISKAELNRRSVALAQSQDPKFQPSMQNGKPKVAMKTKVQAPKAKPVKPAEVPKAKVALKGKEAKSIQAEINKIDNRAYKAGRELTKNEQIKIGLLQEKLHGKTTPLPKNKPKVGLTQSKGYTPKAKQTGKQKTKAKTKAKEPEIEPYVVKGRRVTKDPEIEQVLRGLSKSESVSSTEASLTSIKIESAARELGVKTDRGFIDRYQAGKLKTPAEKKLGKIIRDITDEDFANQKKLTPDIKYTKRHIPQVYAEADDVVQQTVSKTLKTKTGADKQRKFKTYVEAEEAGLTAKYNSVEEILGTRVRETTKAVANVEVIKNGVAKGIFNVKGKGDPIPGLKYKGRQIYAEKRVADVIRGAMQREATGIGRAVNVTAKTAEVAQDVMLQGGLPTTNLNFFVAGQAVKDLTRNLGKFGKAPIQSTVQTKRLLSSLIRGKSGTQKRFADPKTAAFVKELAKEGLTITPQSKVSTIGETWARKKWDTLGNNPTFGRYMPNRMLDTAEEVYSQALKKKVPHKEAVKLAADTTKTYIGIVDTMAKGRSKLANDAMGTALFAPKYRESIMTALSNVVKSVYPTNWSNPKFAPSRELLAGMAISLAGYEALQRKLTGHSMLDNREGQELSLEIPYGDKDEKGNQKVINIPFMPGFTFVPRAVASGAVATVKGDVKGALGAAGKFGSGIVQSGSSLINNKDWKGDPIYIDDDTAALEGIAPDSNKQRTIKSGIFAGGQFSPAWIRGGIEYLQGKPLERAIATALEAPIRFGTKLNPATQAYFDDYDEVYGKLDKNARAVWDTVRPKSKNINGEYMIDQKSIDHGLARAANLLNSKDALEAENEMARRAKARGEKADPLYDLDNSKQRIALRMDTLALGDPVRAKLRKDNDWLNDLADARSAYYDSLPPGDPNKPKGPITYPEPSAEVNSKKKAYYELEDSGMKRDFLKNNPDVVDQFAREEQYTRGVRALKDLPQYDKYPEADKETQNIIDFYMAMPQKESNGKSKVRSAWIKSHPKEWEKMSEHFDKLALYNLQQDMQMSAFEGEDPTEKGIKAIASLGGGSGSGSGYSGYSKDKSNAFADTHKYTVNTAAKGGRIKQPSINKSRVALKLAPVKTAKPKVTLKKSKV